MLRDKVNKCLDDVASIFNKKNKKPKKEKPKVEHTHYDISAEQGLSSEQVQERILAHETNKVKSTTDRSYAKIIFNNFFTFYNILMITVALILILVVGPEVILNLMYLVVLTINLVIGIIQECKSKKTISKLKLLTKGKIKVIRDGAEQEIDSDDIVLDDILVLGIGDQIPADCIIKTDSIVEINESMLTGESKPVKKTAGDQIYAGSFIVSGSCVCSANKVGDETYMYSIESKAKLFKKPKSKLMIYINRITKILASIAIPLSIVVFWNEIIGSTDNLKNAVLFGGTTIAYMIPCGLVLITSVTMTMSVIKLAQHKTLLQDLYSVEMLARVDCICLDKTGTITDGTMTLNEVFRIDSSFDLELLMSNYLGAFTTMNQTSKALAKKYFLTPTEKPISVIEFSSARKYSAVEFKNGIYALGAPEYLTKDKDLLSRAADAASHGLRVVLLTKCSEITEDSITPSKPLVMFMIQDHIRPEIPETMAWFRNNDVDIKIISGDNVATVSYIAKQAGIRNWDRCVDMTKIDKNELDQIVMENSIFGRATPDQKAEIISILKKHGKTVSVTGDGINDVPSMKKADCAIALAEGSPATKNIANIVLLDSNFSNMQKAVLEGRRVINNTQRSSSLFVMKDICWFFVTLLPLLLGMPHVFEPTIMTLVNIIFTGIGSFLLAMEPDTSKYDGNFIKTVLTKSISAGFFMFLPIFVCFIYAFARCGISDVNAIASYVQTNMVSVASLCVTIAGAVIMFVLCQPFTKYRKIVYGFCITVVFLLLTAMPEFFLINGTEFMNELLSSSTSFTDMFMRILKMLFTFNVYKSFTVDQWIIVGAFMLVSTILYYIVDRYMSRTVDKTMFSRKPVDEINDDDED